MRHTSLRIAYVGPFSFPASHANSLRVSGVARTLALSGADVVIGAADRETPDFESEYLFEGVSVHPLGEFPQADWPRWRRVLRGLDAGKRTAQWIENLYPRPDAILVYGTPFGYLRRLLPLARRMRVPLLLDVVEWYDPSHIPGGKYGPVSLAFEYSMRRLATQSDGAFVISRYLEAYFNSKGMPTLRVPPLFSPVTCRPNQFRAADGWFHLCYAGVSGKKDKLGTVLQAVTSLSPHNTGVELHLVGVSNVDLITLMKAHDLTIPTDGSKIRITAHGRVENAISRSIVGSCDFTVLLRDQARYSQAGFPSKVAESLVLGTPVIANLSSNLDEVLMDGRNSILVSGSDATSLMIAIDRAISIESNSLARMKECSREDGVRLFCLKNHVDSLRDFIMRLAK